ncbi:MAG: carbohydrate kinase, partial [Oscillibacter sp.]|nr:carbohydrate kinase [Oscillibacter sp.]
GINLVLVTLGGAGVYYRLENGGAPVTGTVPGFSVKIADTNGAGDTFFGAVLRCLAKRETPLGGLEKEELERILRFANKAASLTVSRPGALPAMPWLKELEEEGILP